MYFLPQDNTDQNHFEEVSVMRMAHKIFLVIESVKTNVRADHAPE